MTRRFKEEDFSTFIKHINIKIIYNHEREREKEIKKENFKLKNKNKQTSFIYLQKHQKRSFIVLSLFLNLLTIRITYYILPSQSTIIYKIYITSLISTDIHLFSYKTIKCCCDCRRRC